MTFLGFLLWDLKQSRSAYEKRYEKELGTAFSREKWQRRRLTYAWGAYHEKRYQAALKVLDRLTARCDEDRRSVLLVTALCLTDLDRQAEAEAIYRRLLERFPEYATALSNLGLAQRGKRADALFRGFGILLIADEVSASEAFRFREVGLGIVIDGGLASFCHG